MIKSWDQIGQITRGKPNTTVLVNNVAKKLFIGKCLGQPPSHKIPLEVDGNIYRDHQPGNMQKVRNTGTFNLKLEVWTKSLPSWIREYFPGRVGKIIKGFY